MTTEQRPMTPGLWGCAALMFGVLIGGVGQMFVWPPFGAWGLLLIPIVALLIFVGGVLTTALSKRLSGGTKAGLSTIGVWMLRMVGVAVGLALVGFGIWRIIDYTPDCVPSETVRCVGIRNGQDVGDVGTGEQTGQNFFVSLILIVPGAVLLFFTGRSVAGALRD